MPATFSRQGTLREGPRGAHHSAAVRSRSHALAVALLLTPALACVGDRPTELAPTPPGDGPRVRYDVAARPFPEVPFPNDAATRLDPSSPTGRRLDISITAPTEVERRTRKRLNTLPGFGLLSPITVSFDAPLELAGLHQRHAADRDPANDGILLLRLGDEGDACAPDRLVPLDLGQGYYPLVLDRPCQYQYHPWVGDFICDPVPPCEGDDPRWTASNTVFETTDEDLDGDGVLDPYEDTDFDGRLDRPNTWSGTDGGSADADDLITFYEKETDTLIAWPVIPLREATRYAVVLTRHLTGVDGEPVRSPFPGISAADHAEPLAQLEELLPCHGLGLEDVAFAWVYTTGAPTRELIALRAGLYGSGPFAELGPGNPVDQMRPKLARDPEPDGSLPPSAYVLPNDVLLPVMEILAGELLVTPGAGAQLYEDAVHVHHWVAGEFEAPYLLVDKDGRATERYPDDQDELFRLDVDQGTVTWAPGTVPFVCSIPVETEAHHAPFPVVLYGHGYSGATFEILGFAGRYARAGYALCAIEAPGHGVVIPDSEQEIIDALDFFLPQLGLETFYDAYTGGRVRDNDHDGRIGERDNGTDFWVADAFHTRDMVRQLLLDELQFIRILRAVDGVQTMDADTDGDGQPNPLADFDGDGIPDIGGWADHDRDGLRDPSEPEHPFYAWGQSLGGISTAVLAGVEPAVRAAVPVSSAGGLVHVALRSTNLGVPDAIMLPLMGPFVTFAPHLGDDGAPDGRVDVGFLVVNVNEPVRPVFHVSEAIEPGDRVLLQNLRTGEEVAAWAPEDLTFRVGVAADALRVGDKRQALALTEETELPVDVGPGALPWAGLGDPLRVVVLDGWDGPPKEVIDEVTQPFYYQGVNHLAGTPLFALHEGLGYTRNSPDFRRILGLAQAIMEPGDPAAYARFIHQEPLDFPYETGDVLAAREAGRLTHMLQIHTVGDPDVPVAAGMVLARAAGLIDDATPDPATGRTEMETLIDHYVVEGVERTLRYPQRKEPMVPCPPSPASEWRCPPVRLGEEDRYRAWYEAGTCDADLGQCDVTCPEGEACFYDDVCAPCDTACAAMADFPVEGVMIDVEDHDAHADLLVLPEYHLDQPLRATRAEGPGVYGLRIPYMDRYGSHGVPPSIPERAFDINSFVVNQILWFLVSDGEELSDDPCLAAGDCDFLPWNQ